MTFTEAVKLAQEKGIRAETQYGNFDDGVTILHLKDNSALIFFSQYEESYSKDTPGQGFEPPVVAHVTQLSEISNYMWLSDFESLYGEIYAQ